MDVPTISTILLTLFWGIAVGCIYILLATGLNIIFGVMKLVNFAHGQLLMIGAYFAWTFVTATGLNAYIGILAAAAGVAVLGVVVEKLTFRRVLGTEKLNEIFISLGLIYIFENAAMLIWGDKFNEQIKTPLNNLSLAFGSGLWLSYDRIIAMVVVVAVLIGLTLLLKKTKIGLAMRATSQRSSTAMLMGVNVDRVYLFTFGLGAALAGAAGALYGIIFSFNYQIGAMPTTIAFAIIILGGLGSIRGAIIGGLLYGVAEQMATLFLGGTWANAVAFALLIIVLGLRPTGIFGEKGE